MDQKSSLEIFNRNLVKLAARQENIVLLVGDSANLMNAKIFQDVFPDRYFNFGISYQNLVAVAAGMASVGKMPFVLLPSSKFSAAWEQIRNLICFPNLNVKLIGSYAGLGSGFGGGIKQFYEDLALMRVLPNMKVAVPMDCNEAAFLAESVVNTYGPVYVRLSQEENPYDQKIQDKFTFGQSKIVRGGKDVLVFSNGDFVGQLLKAAEKLDADHDLAVSVVNISSVKPLDKNLIIQKSLEAKKILVIEEHSVIGGLGSAIMELLSENGVGKKVIRIGMNDCFGKSDSRENLLDYYRWSLDKLIEQILIIAN